MPSVPALLLAATAGLAGGKAVPLTEAARAMPEQIAVVETWLRERQQDPSEFVVETQDCDAASCQIHVYPATALESGADRWRGCPVSMCVTLELDAEPMFVVHATHWR